MAECIFRNGRVIKDYGEPYIIAEVNSSHNGDINEAKAMCNVAKAMGCDCVKFQSWTAESIYSKTHYEKSPMSKRFFDKFSLDEEKLGEVSKYCKSIGIDFASTPYSNKEADFLVDYCRVPFIKVASMDLDNYQFLEYIGQKGCPIILSTGMGECDEIKKAVEILDSTGNKNIAVLHCVSIYPTNIEDINLNNIVGLRDMIPHHPIGFSDHTKGNECAIASIALGACIVEKHLTLDSSKIGMDNQMATEPEEFKDLVRKCKSIQKSLGSFERKVSQDELEQRIKMRRSIVATQDLRVGDKIKPEHLCAKRPGNGISPSHISKIIGKKLIRDVKADTLIFWSDLT
ncbi:N-acetylneuraminate synthase family protein [Helicobacter labetoulli]|uniref:N-acetylneuraminate synthase family protein n=1 Tax=Helicobacter labetoulli TaxID=2315333 RepID=UPI000EF7202B|nr:N-acetylneuraminate synthase family protein [Helicobacter labetoulli]